MGDPYGSSGGTHNYPSPNAARSHAHPAANLCQESAAVDWSALRGSPAEAMQDTLAWVRREYGAVDAFLEGAGADEAWRRTLLSSRLEV